MKQFDQIPFYNKIRLNLAVAVTLLLLFIASAIPNAFAAVYALVMEQGIRFGDLAPGHAIVWSHADRPARMMV